MNQRRRLTVIGVAAAIACAAAVTAVSTAQGAGRPTHITIGIYSENEGHARARAGASINAVSGRPATSHRRYVGGRSTITTVVPMSVQRSSATPPYPTLAANAPLIKNPTPFGPGTFWYQGGNGLACIYAAGSSPLCYRITGATSPKAPGIDPARLAASVAAHFDLGPGRISVSPASAGLTGAASWFWLDPAPASHETTITLAGETLTVVATPTVDWDFGDGSQLTDAGPGRPYAPGPAPPEAVTRIYETRCLPGDRGRDPNVLAQCTSGGYSVVAAVVWHFAYRASGPVSGSGTVPARTTETGVDYPVSEARAFLIGGGR